MFKRLLIQISFILAIAAITGVLINNLVINLIVSDMGISFKWLSESSGFELAEKSLGFQPSDSYALALTVGWINSLKVILLGLIVSTNIGIITGILSTNGNLILRRFSSFYIAIIRQIPLLLQLMFWYFVAFLGLSSDSKPIPFIGNLIILSNQGIRFLGIDISVEFAALVIGLSIFTGASIAEVVRGGLKSVPKGQWEAFRSIGLSEKYGLRHVIMPQALPAIIPGLTSQYLNLAKNSTLAIAIGYSDIYAVSDTSITQTGRAIEGFIVLLTSFLLFNLLISSLMEIINTKFIIYKPRK